MPSEWCPWKGAGNVIGHYHITGRAVVLIGSPHSDSSSLCVSPPPRGESPEADFPLPSSLQSHAHFRVVWKWETHSIPKWRGVERLSTGFGIQISAPSPLAVWPWAIYLNLPEPQFPRLYKWCLFPCRVDVGMKGRILDLPGTYWMVTSWTASVVGAGLGNSHWFGSALLSDLPWFGPGSLSESRGIPVPIPALCHHPNFA